MAPSGYQELDHTADLALKVWADDFHALLSCALQGMYHLMRVEMDESWQAARTFTVRGAALETQLVDFLNELLYYCEDHGLVFDEVTFQDTGEGFTVFVEGYQMKKCERLIKAATFHDLQIEKTEAGLKTVIVFDV
jgi:SHS2 domain-containing protein